MSHRHGTESISDKVLLWAMAKGSMNAKTAFLHNITDAGVTLAVLLGGAAIYWLEWNWVDPSSTCRSG
ncbi:hypothetical protein [Pelagicoccus sp. SDUM812002]|uniref:hypothetical protein n=1 Tax=Pelagicoccus sp. SDUM812002 TaxID=3041266 RepID=UPI00280C7028|nr:hypothetical protein [Pelagicoccus sp. SDUM812002]MDQ8184129.1 hypothetical protein [Pelagicoccus sp. SDUM812002]